MSIEVDPCDIDDLKLKVEKFLNNNNYTSTLRRIETLKTETQDENISKKSKQAEKLNSNLIYLTGTPNKKQQNQPTSPSTKCLALDLNEKDLKILLQNFYKLEGNEQQVLISHLKKLEVNNPVLVNNLKEFACVTPPVPENELHDANELEILDELDDILQATETEQNPVEETKEDKQFNELKSESETKQVNTNTPTAPLSKKQLKRQRQKLRLQMKNAKIAETKTDSIQKETVEKSIPQEPELKKKNEATQKTAKVNKNKMKKKLNRMAWNSMYDWTQSTYQESFGYDYRDYREWYRYDTYNMPAYYRNYYSFADNNYY